MERLPRQSYTQEYREQAVKLVAEEKLTIPAAARRLSMSQKTLANWVHKTRHGQLSQVGDSGKPVTALDAEVSRLKRELAEARMERDILKNVSRCCTSSCEKETPAVPILPGLEESGRWLIGGLPRQKTWSRDRCGLDIGDAFGQSRLGN